MVGFTKQGKLNNRVIPWFALYFIVFVKERQQKFRENKIPRGVLALLLPEKNQTAGEL